MGTQGELILTIDGGGTSAKVSAYSTSSHHTVASAAVEYAANYPAPEFAEFDPGSWWAAVVRAVKLTVERASVDPSTYAGITCTGMRIPFLLLDSHGAPLAPGVLNVDRRGQGYLGRIRSAARTREAL